MPPINAHIGIYIQRNLHITLVFVYIRVSFSVREMTKNAVKMDLEAESRTGFSGGMLPYIFFKIFNNSGEKTVPEGYRNPGLVRGGRS